VRLHKKSSNGAGAVASAPELAPAPPPARPHAPAEGLLGPQLSKFQGPALLVYNDAAFSERDFESIGRIGNSAKREQKGKTGRFG